MVVHPDIGKVVAVVMVCVVVAEALVALSVNPVVNPEGSYIDRHHRLMYHQHVDMRVICYTHDNARLTPAGPRKLSRSGK